MEGKILVVHRNELILDVIQEMLHDVGYAVSLRAGVIVGHGARISDMKQIQSEIPDSANVL